MDPYMAASSGALLPSGRPGINGMSIAGTLSMILRRLNADSSTLSSPGTPAVLIDPVRSLERHFQAFINERTRDRPAYIKAFAHRAGGGQYFVDRQIEFHAVNLVPDPDAAHAAPGIDTAYPTRSFEPSPTACAVASLIGRV
jgi:hypothetical protein